MVRKIRKFLRILVNSLLRHYVNVLLKILVENKIFAIVWFSFLEFENTKIINLMILNLKCYPELDYYCQRRKDKNSLFPTCLPQVKEKYGKQNILYDIYIMYRYIPTFRTCFNSLRALRIVFGDQFHIVGSSSFFFKGCKIIGVITKVPLYSIKVTGVVPGPYQLWRRMFGS